MERFIDRYSAVTRDGSGYLLEWLTQSDFFVAPASTKYHGSFERGLVEHSVNVYDRLKRLADFEFPGKWSDETLAICGLLHDVCKADYYKQDWKNQKVYSDTGSKRDNKGRFEWESVPYYTVDDQLPYGHGEKSVYIISSFMKLTREEAMAIRWHMGGFDESVKGGSYAMGEAYNKFPLALLLHLADMEATYLDEKMEEEE